MAGLGIRKESTVGLVAKKCCQKAGNLPACFVESKKETGKTPHVRWHIIAVDGFSPMFKPQRDACRQDSQDRFHVNGQSTRDYSVPRQVIRRPDTSIPPSAGFSGDPRILLEGTAMKGGGAGFLGGRIRWLRLA